jgi:hypothetical protein
VALFSRFLYPGRGPIATRKPSEVTVTPKNGRPVTGKLEFIDDFNVGLRDSAGYFRSWPREGVTLDLRDPYAAHADLLGKYTDNDIHNVMTYLVTLK